MRIRSIKPEFWRSSDISSLQIEDRLLFIGLWSYVDDNGVGIDKLAAITADLFADDLEKDASETFARVSRGLLKLSEAKRITRYVVDGAPFLCIANWGKHQRIDKPGKPRFPRPDADLTEIRESVASVSEKVAPGTGEQGNRGTGEQGAGEQKKRASPQPIPADFVVADDMRSWAKEVTPAVNIATNTTEFIDHWKGDGGKKADWVRAWKNNMKRKQEWAERAGWKPAALDMTNPNNWMKP